MPPDSTPEAAAVAALLRDALAAGQTPALTVISASMRPLLEPGDVVEIEPIDPGRLKPGDLVVLARPEALLTHRFLGFSGEYLCTGGDWAREPDAPQPAETLLGRVRTRRRGAAAIDLQAGPGARASRTLWHLAERRRRLVDSRPAWLRRPLRVGFLLAARIWLRLSY